MCKKKPFDRVGAMLAIAEAKVKSGWKRKELRMYWCKQCSAFHLTSQEKRK